MTDVSANRQGMRFATVKTFSPKKQASAQELGGRHHSLDALGFPASCLYVAIADRANGFEMPPDIPASELKK
ncbi:hypothetical protein NKJ06_06555 [Mesorhizobium sp. M0293]|uniref:hypothetical protein n=1 Tax=unclassified Mesorhizobium TaxID=325217 RepID=UPI0033356386